MEEWVEYFKKLLRGMERKVMLNNSRHVAEDEKDIRREEAIRAVKKLRDGKVAGGDGVPAELWKYGGTEVQN